MFQSYCNTELVMYVDKRILSLRKRKHWTVTEPTDHRAAERQSSAPVQQLTSRGQELLLHEVLEVQIFVLQVEAQELLHHRPAPVSHR